MSRRNRWKPACWRCAARNDRSARAGRPDTMPIIAMLIGATLGFWLGHNFDALVGGGFVGLIVGLIIHQYRKRAPSQVVDPGASRFAAIEARLARLESALERAGLAPLQPPERPTSASAAAPAPEASVVAAPSPIEP